MGKRLKFDVNWEILGNRKILFYSRGAIDLYLLKFYKHTRLVNAFETIFLV